MFCKICRDHPELIFKNPGRLWSLNSSDREELRQDGVLTEVSSPLDHNGYMLSQARAREPKTALKETCTLDINQNRNNHGQLDGTEKMVEKAMGCLVRQFKKNGRQPVDYFQFIHDPKSFSKTIENMIHVSFLVNIRLPSIPFPKSYFQVKEGTAAVKLNEETE